MTLVVQFYENRFLRIVIPSGARVSALILAVAEPPELIRLKC